MTVRPLILQLTPRTGFGIHIQLMTVWKLMLHPTHAYMLHVSLHMREVEQPRWHPRASTRMCQPSLSIVPQLLFAILQASRLWLIHLPTRLSEGHPKSEETSTARSTLQWAILTKRRLQNLLAAHVVHSFLTALHHSSQ